MPPASALRERLYRSLGPRAVSVRKIVRTAVERGAPPYLVGGPVRDLFLRRPILDVDLLLPHDLEGVAHAAANALGAKLILHRRFLTARIETATLRIDLSQARAEHYPTPGSLPVVRPGTVEQDLDRRDFTMQAMALPLHRAAGSRLLDSHGGLVDLRRGLVRILHDRSFLDDPTRTFRAARYVARFRFQLTRRTRLRLDEAVAGGALDSLSGDRILHEVERLLAESDPVPATRRTVALGLFGATARGWQIGPGVARALRRLTRARARPPWPGWESVASRPESGLRILLLDSPAQTRGRVLERLAFRGRPAREIEEGLRRLPRLRRALARSRSRGSLDALLSELGEPTRVLLYCAATGAGARALARWARVDRLRASPIDGHDARRLGAVGPQIGVLLRAARRRALDGEPVDSDWARRWLARRR